MRTALAAAALCLAAAGMARSQPTAGAGRPQLVLSPPDGVAWPDSAPAIEDTDAARDAYGAIFAGLMDGNGDGLLSPEELRPWVVQVRMAPTVGAPDRVEIREGSVLLLQAGTWTQHGAIEFHEGSVQFLQGGTWTPLQGTFEVGQGTIEVLQGERWTPVSGTIHVQEGTLHVLEGGTWMPVESEVRILEGGTWTPLQDTIGVEAPVAMPLPPECTQALRSSEQRPQAQDAACGASAGQLLFRTVCNAPGCDSQAIALPDGRDADCFGIEALTPGSVSFSIYPESDPANALYDSRRDGLRDLARLRLADTGVYRIDLDEAGSAPDARVTVRYVDHPE